MIKKWLHFRQNTAEGITRIGICLLMGLLVCMPEAELLGHSGKLGSGIAGDMDQPENPGKAFFSEYVFYSSLAAARQSSQARSARQESSPAPALHVAANLHKAPVIICSFLLFYILIMHRSLISLSLGGRAPPAVL